MAAPTAMFALLYFCGSYHVHLVAPVLQNISLPYTSYSPSSGHISNASALLAFGGQVSATLTAGRVTNNTGITAMLLMDDAAVTVVDTVFPGNQGHQGPACLVLHQAQLVMAGSYASSNVATEGGGVLFAQDNARVNVTNSTFANNSVLPPSLVMFAMADGGGVISAHDNATVSVTNSSMVGNSAAWAAGALAASHTSTNECCNVHFVAYHAMDGGCARSVDMSSINFMGCTFQNNSASIGGAVTSRGLQCVLNHCIFIHNNALDTGGAVEVGGQCKLNTHHTAMVRNHAGQAGGAANLDGSCVAIVSGSRFEHNVVTGSIYFQGGGGICLQFAVVLLITDTIISDDTAQLGGGVYAADNCTVLITNSELVNNSAESGGGLLATADAKVGVASSKVAFNAAMSTAVGNVAFVGGGGVAAANSASITITGSDISSNTATLGAGLVAVNAATLTVNGHPRQVMLLRVLLVVVLV
jgi:hypothetical protein